MIKSFYIAFENSDEWEYSADWGVFCSRYYFPDATIKENKVNIAGSNGVIDLSSELTGDVVFNNVQGEIGFIILQDSNFDYNAFKNKYHGKRVKIRPDNDMDFYRIGRLLITKDNNQDVLRKVEMKLDADPFRYNITETVYKIDIKEPETPSLTASDLSNVTSSVSDGGIEFSNVKTSSAEYYVSWELYRSQKIAQFALKFPTQKNTNYSLTFKIKFYCKNMGTNKPPYVDLKKIMFNTFYSEPIRFSWNGGEFTFPTVFDENSVFPISINFNSGDEENFIMNFAGKYAKWSKLDTIDAHIKEIIPIIKVYDVKLVSGTAVSIINAGRKQVVPEITASEDCEIIINGISDFFEAGETKRSFDLVINTQENSIIANGENGGEVQIKYREAYL